MDTAIPANMNVSSHSENMEMRKRKQLPRNYFIKWFYPEKKRESFDNEPKKLKSNQITSKLIVLGLFASMAASVLIMYPFIQSFFPVLKEDSPITTKQPILSDWHEKVKSIRSPEVINPRFDNMFLSILISNGKFTMDSKVHESIGTVLRQVKHLQVCNDRVANTFEGGEPGRVLPFFVEVPELPRLERYIDAFKTMYETQPHLEWYIQIDEDTFVFLENIKMYLSSFNPDQLIFIHNFDVLEKDSVRNPELDDPNHFPISIISRGAMEKLMKTGYSSCFHNKKKIHSMGTILVRCLEAMGINAVPEQGLHRSEPAHDFSWPANACDRPLALSKLSHSQMLALYKARPATGSSNHGAYRWDTIVTYSDVFHHTFPTSEPTLNIDRHSPGESPSVIVDSGKDCLKLCEQKQHCVSWTFDKGDCHLGNTVGVAIERRAVVSGLIPSRYNCN